MAGLSERQLFAAYGVPYEHSFDALDDVFERALDVDLIPAANAARITPLPPPMQIGGCAVPNVDNRVCTASGHWGISAEKSSNSGDADREPPPIIGVATQPQIGGVR